MFKVLQKRETHHVVNERLVQRKGFSVLAKENCTLKLLIRADLNLLDGACFWQLLFFNIVSCYGCSLYFLVQFVLSSQGCKFKLPVKTLQARVILRFISKRDLFAAPLS